MHIPWTVLATFNICVQCRGLSTQDPGQEYGIGFDFTPAYATAAVSFANGSNIAVARIDGDAPWRTLMADLSWDEMGNLGATTESPAVTILANMLQSLASVGERFLGEPIRAASVNLPARNIISRGGTPVADLVKEAFTAASIEYVQIADYSYFGEPLLYPENTILASHGLGLCQPYTSTLSCLDDEEQRRHMPRETYYLVGYYSNELEVITTSPTVSVYGVLTRTTALEQK